MSTDLSNPSTAPTTSTLLALSAAILLVTPLGCDDNSEPQPDEAPDQPEATAPTEPTDGEKAPETEDPEETDETNDNGAATDPAEPTEEAAPEAPEDRDDGDDLDDVALPSSALDRICDDRTPCEKMRQWDAGTDDETALTVVEIALHDRGNEGRQPDRLDCAPFEYWVVQAEDDEVVDKHHVRRICNDGYGARGFGHDTISVEDNTLEHTQTGGSSWIWTRTEILQLVPPRVVEEHVSGELALDINYEDDVWNWDRPGGGVEWNAPRCDERNGPEQRPPEAGPYHYAHLMQIELEDSFREGDWKTTELGDCSLRVDAAGRGDDYDGGFVVHGDAADPRAAKFRAVMGSPTELFVEIRDAEWIDGADNWIYDDHLEIWTGDRFRYANECLDLSDPVQWGVALFDDELHPGYGDPEQPPFDVQRHEVRDGDEVERVRMKIEFESEPDALTVVYSDTEDGDSQQRLIATSDLDHGDPASLGRLRNIRSYQAGCRIEDGSLVFEDRREF